MGAWGDESCSNDSCWDAMCVFKDIHDIDQTEVEGGLEAVFSGKQHESSMDKLGVVIWLLRHGLRVPKKYLDEALDLVDECLEDVESEGWRDPKSRRAQLEKERKDIENALAHDGEIPEEHIPGLLEKFMGGE